MASFLMIDRLTALAPGRSAEGTWQVPASDGVFSDHFPRRPVLPGVLMVEGLQQLAVFLLEHGQWQSGRAVRARLVAVEGVKFRGIVGPGETLTCRVEAASVSESGAAAAATVSKGGDEIASCRLIFAWAPDDPAGAADRIERLLRAWDWGPPAASAPSISR